MSRQITAATLPQNNGIIYHIADKANDLSDNIILVGDPERAPKIAKLIFDENQPRYSKLHRGLATETGYTKDGFRISIVTHGMGTGSAEIVINEILALKRIDVEKREILAEEPKTPVNIIRLGTSGALQKSTELGTPIITKYSIGLDSTGLFYDIKTQNENVEKLEKLVKEKLDNATLDNVRFKDCIKPYVTAINPIMVDALIKSAEEYNLKNKVGMTVTAPGFFNCQGRQLFREMPNTIFNVDEVFEPIEFDGIKPENMEMEVSIITHISSAFKWCRAGALCMIVANRVLNTFADDTERTLSDCVHVAVSALKKLSKIPL